MNARLILLMAALGLCLTASARNRKASRYDMTEQDLAGQIVACLNAKNGPAYVRLFPESDSLATWTVKIAPQNSEAFQKMSYQLDHPSIGLKKDSVMDARLTANFDSLLLRGEDMGITWTNTILARYELVRQPKTRDSIYEKLAPTRFTGYLFVLDRGHRKTYGVKVSDMLRINDRYYGGALESIFIAETIDEYERKKAIEERRIRKGKAGNYGEDSSFVAVTREGDEDAPKVRKNVVDRKIFIGTFDEDIRVEVYIRYIKGSCPEGICSWDAALRFGDNEEVPMTVTRAADGKWHFEEENGVMDLVLDKSHFTGSWVNGSDQTSYDVDIEEAPLSNKKRAKYEDLLNRSYSE